ncbi:polyprotein [Phytophthora megakarya]|uniref:Polyprotein n=1 Tax=Phytophthora megakarya TaxID=4795 RepID=A0A225WHY6_9STRA|nr:polyprotein [Phytophthora megakarya]
MAAGRVFSIMDRFYQVKLRDDSIPYTGFVAPDGLYEYPVIPYGTYFDNIFGFSSTDSIGDHLEHQLFIKLSKFTFCATEILCLGDRIDCEDVKMDPAKVFSSGARPFVKTKHKIQSFLGKCVYVLRLCPSVAELCVPLVNLTKGRSSKGSIHFEHHKAFNKLKRQLALPTVLFHPNFSKPFHVNIDASDFAIGGYIYQTSDDGKNMIIAYRGRKLSKAEVIYPTREKRVACSDSCNATLERHLIDKPFYINTDHKAIGILRLNKPVRSGWHVG